MGIFGDIGELAAPHCVSSAASVSAPTLLGYFRAPRISGHPLFSHLCFSMGNVVIQKQVLEVAALLAFLSGCDSQKGDTATPATAGLPKLKEASASAPPSLPMKPPSLHDLAVGERVYKNTCSICHRLGLRGAPRLGDTEDWVLRLAQGNEILYDHAVKGYRGSKGSMPSRGSNAKLSEDEVKAAVDYMVWYSVPKSHDSFGSHVFSATTKQFTIR